MCSDPSRSGASVGSTSPSRPSPRAARSAVEELTPTLETPGGSSPRPSPSGTPGRPSGVHDLFTSSRPTTSLNVPSPISFRTHRMSACSPNFRAALASNRYTESAANLATTQPDFVAVDLDDNHFLIETEGSRTSTSLTRIARRASGARTRPCSPVSSAVLEGSLARMEQARALGPWRRSAHLRILV